MTIKTKAYTPGPWHADEGQIRNPDGWALGSYPWSGNIADQTDRNNGELMAAAPVLLEACIFALSELEDMTTAEFQRGADQRAREVLTAAIIPFIDHEGR